MRVLGLVPARGGSRGIARKNLKPLGGKPLLAYTAEAALAARRLERVVLSTEDDEIAALGRSLGLEVPFRRPTELAGDSTPTLAVVRHALQALAAAGARFDAVCLLQPTSPFRAAGEIDACIALLGTSGADGVVSVARIPAEHHPAWAYTLGDGGRLRLVSGDTEPPPRRQDLPAAYYRTGSVYVTRTAVVERHGLYGLHTVGHQVDDTPLVNLDTPGDWEVAERLLAAATRAST